MTAVDKQLEEQVRKSKEIEAMLTDFSRSTVPTDLQPRPLFGDYGSRQAVCAEAEAQEKSRGRGCDACGRGLCTGRPVG